MPSMEVMIWILTGAISLVSVLGGTIWSMVRAEAKEQSEQIKKKADTDRLQETELRWQQDLVNVKSDNRELIDKLSARHDREIDQLSTRLSDAIRNSEANILSQLRLMLSLMGRTDGTQ